MLEQHLALKTAFETANVAWHPHRASADGCYVGCYVCRDREAARGRYVTARRSQTESTPSG
eukprot:3729717-Pleurochrysis_carterae.AAC.2